MAVCLNGLSEQERVNANRHVIREMLKNCLGGSSISTSPTGGIGDNVLILSNAGRSWCICSDGPGRGLGHTGEHWTNWESIPGYRTQISGEEFEKAVTEIGCTIVGAGEGIAPVDKRLYAIRDLTGTVESIDLITSSILSKKLSLDWRP